MISSARHKMLIDFSLCQVITGSVFCRAHNCCKSSKIIQLQQFAVRETAAAQAVKRSQSPALKSPHFFTRRRSLVRVQQSPPRKNLGITMVPRFFLCLFLEEKSLSACGILGYFRVISGLLVAKVLQIFSALYPLCHKGLRLFRQSRLLQTF